MFRYWFGDTEGGKCVSCPWWNGGQRAWELRSRRFAGKGGHLPPPEWGIAVEANCVRNREEYLQRLREFCIADTTVKLTEFAQRRDLELVEMIRALDEIDRAANMLQERVTEWRRITNPGTDCRGSRRAEGETDPFPNRTGGALGILEEEICQLQSVRNRLAQEVTAMADTVLPNSSSLVGGIVAARLLAHAGDLDTLAKMPASTLQVMGAKKALFSHLQTGTPPPRHGIIYQYKRIHTAPRSQRGKVARVVACRLCTAVRLDRLRGSRVPEFLTEANERIEGAVRKK
jgi:nucleolar protein 56